MKTLIISILIVLSLSGCKIAYQVILGVDPTPGWKWKKNISRDFDRRNIPPENRFVLDTASYYHAILSELNCLKADSLLLDSAQFKLLRKVAYDDLQPTQVRFFDKKGDPLFKLVNCYIDPPIPMSWNVNKCFDSFPPKIDIPELNYCNKHLSFFLPHIKNLDGKPVALIDLPPADYYVIIYWNSFYRRPSKRLIKTVKKNVEKYPKEKTMILYVNNHNAEIWRRLDPVQRELVQNILRSHEN